MKKIISLFLAVATLVACLIIVPVTTASADDYVYEPMSYNLSTDTAWYENNPVADGTKADYTIKNKGELAYFMYLGTQGKTFKGQSIKLSADITVNEGTASITGFVPKTGNTIYTWTPYADFRGSFYGQGYTISGLYITAGTNGAGADKATGFFAKSATGLMIYRLGIVNSFAISTTALGTALLCGQSDYGCTLEDCYMQGFIKATVNTSGKSNNVGGYIGQRLSNDVKRARIWKFTNCVMDGEINASACWSCGGFVGFPDIHSVEMVGCINYAKVTANTRVGGFVGNITTDTTLTNCINYGTIATSGNNTGSVGSIGCVCKPSAKFTLTCKDVYNGSNGNMVGQYGNSLNLDIKVSYSLGSTVAETTTTPAANESPSALSAPFTNKLPTGDNTDIYMYALQAGKWYKPDKTAYYKYRFIAGVSTRANTKADIDKIGFEVASLRSTKGFQSVEVDNVYTSILSDFGSTQKTAASIGSEYITTLTLEEANTVQIGCFMIRGYVEVDGVKQYSGTLVVAVRGGKVIGTAKITDAYDEMTMDVEGDTFNPAGKPFGFANYRVYSDDKYSNIIYSTVAKDNKTTGTVALTADTTVVYVKMWQNSAVIYNKLTINKVQK